jgi:Cu(I)/Ag(I) efflux system membrane fusion protein
MNTRIVVAAGTLIATAAIGGWLLARHGAAPAHQHRLEKQRDAQGKIYYTCPMHPQVRQDHPGHCPICGMPLVRRMDAAGGQDAAAEPSRGVVQIDPRMAQNLGMRVAAVTRGRLHPQIEAVGSVALDERRIIVVESRAAGWIEKLDVRAQGDAVRKGQRLAALYAPELAAAEQELALARSSGDATLEAAARQRLRGLGGGSGLFSPIDGYVIELMSREGARLEPGAPLMKLADLSRVWLVVEIPEMQTAWVREGGPAQARLRALPGRVFEGRVDYLYPQLDSSSRTLKARLVFDNPDGALRPGAFADVSLSSGLDQDVLKVPGEALIRTGERNTVIVAEAEGRYRPVPVVPGAEQGNEVAILSGLEEGQRVVVSGQFLIDSEAALQGAYRRMQAAVEAQP